jgi:hypothetical protein
VLSRGPDCVGVFSTPLHLRVETDPVSEMSCFYSQEHSAMEKVQKPSNSMCITQVWKGKYFVVHCVCLSIVFVFQVYTFVTD